MEDSKKSGKKRQPITIEMKKEIIKKYEEGVTLTQLGRLYDRSVCVFVVYFCIYISLRAIFNDFCAFFCDFGGILVYVERIKFFPYVLQFE